MSGLELGPFLKMYGSKFFVYLFPKIKQSKSFRDFKKKWTKDNYEQKTTDMFKAAVEDAKKSLALPEKLVLDLLDDPINRKEVFKWILTGSSEGFNQNNLNFDPYMEKFPAYQDVMRPFFEIIFLNLEEYKEIYWEPEFLEIINKIDELEELTEKKFETIDYKQDLTLDVTKENNRYLQELIMPVEFEDLRVLMKSGKIFSVREKAIERLKKSTLKPNETLELNLIIANTYIAIRNNNEAVKYLYIAINYCNDESRRKRLEATICLFQKRFEEADKLIKEAISHNKDSNENLNILVNIYIEQGKITDAYQLLENRTEEEFSLLKANVMLSLKKFDEVINMTNQALKNTPFNIDWLMLKAEICILQFEHDITNNKSVNPEKLFNKIMPILEKIENQNHENTAISNRTRELKAVLLFRNSKYTEAKVNLEEIFKIEKNFSGTIFNNLILNCLCSKEWEKVINLLEEKQKKYELSQLEILTLADVFIQIGKGKKAIELLISNNLNFTNSSVFPYNYYFCYVDALVSLLKHNEVKDLLESLEKKEISSVSLNVLKGFYSYKKHEWNNVISFLEPNINKLKNDVLIKCQNYLTLAYIDRGTLEDLEKSKKIVLSIPNWIQYEFFVDRYIQALYKLGEYKTLVKFEENTFLSSTTLLNIMATIHYETKWYDIAKEYYLILYQQSNSLDYLLRYASCVYRMGDITKCVEILSSIEIQVRKTGSFEDYQLLSTAFFDTKEYRKSMEFSYLAFMSGNKNPKVWNFFFLKMSQLSQFVDDPDQKWVAEYNRVISDFQITFPNENPFFKSFDLSKENGIPKELIAELKKSNNSIDQIRTMLSEQKFPVSIIINLMKKGPFESWAHVVNEKDTHLWISEGTTDHLIEGIKNSLISSSILCDFTTLLTMQHLELLDILNESFDVFIYQEQFDLAFHEYTQNKPHVEKGLKILSSKGEEIQKIEYSSENIKNSIKNQEKLISWIRNNCKFLGVKINNRNKELFQDDSLSFLNGPLEICEDRNLVMLIDSLSVQKYAKAEFKINCFSTFDFIGHLILKNIIDNETKNIYLGKLIMMGHAFIPVKADLFVYYLKQNNFKVSNEITVLFDYFNFEEMTDEFLIYTIGEIISVVWIEDTSFSNKKTLIEYLCDLVSNKNAKLLIDLMQQVKSHFNDSSKNKWIQIEKIMVGRKS